MEAVIAGPQSQNDLIANYFMIGVVVGLFDTIERHVFYLKVISVHFPFNLNELVAVIIDIVTVAVASISFDSFKFGAIAVIKDDFGHLC